MLDVLCHANNPNKIQLTDDFQRDVRWFKHFLMRYNGVSIYGHKKSDQTLELDACFKGLVAVWRRVVHNMPIPLGFKDMGMVHLEMINILLAIRVFGEA